MPTSKPQKTKTAEGLAKPFRVRLLRSVKLFGVTYRPGEEINLSHEAAGILTISKTAEFLGPGEIGPVTRRGITITHRIKRSSR